MEPTVAQSRDMTRRTAFNMICNVVTHFLSAVIAFFITPFLVSRIGIEAYGFYPISAEVAALFGLFTGLVNSTANRYITVEKAGGDDEAANRCFSTVFFTNLILCGILLIPMGLFLIFLDGILSVPEGMIGELRAFFCLTLATVLVHALSAAFGSAYWISERLDMRSAQDLIVVLLKTAILFVLLGGGFSSSIVSVGVALLISSIAGAIIQILMCRRLVPELSLSRRHMSRSVARRILSSGFWYTLDHAGAFLMTGGLLILSNVIFTAEGVGVFSISTTVSRAMSGFLLVLTGVFFPGTAKHFAKGEKKQLVTDITTGQKLTGFFAAVSMAGAIGFCDEFYSLWIPEQNSMLLRTLTVISLLPITAIAATLPLVHLGVVMNRMRRLSLLFVGCGLLTMSSVILVSCFTKAGVMGVAIVAAAAQLVWYAVLLPLFAARLLSMKSRIFYAPVLKSFLACGASVGVVLLVKSFSPMSTWLHLAVIGGVCLVAALVISFLCVFGKPKFKI